MVQFITLLSTISILAPTVVGAFFYRRLPPFARVLFIFVVITLLLEALTRIFYELEWNNMFLFHLYSYLEVGFIGWIYITLSSNQRWKLSIFSACALFVFISAINLLFFDQLTHFNSVQRYFEMVFIYAILGTFGTSAVHDPLRSPYHRDPAIILTLGFMLYFLGTLFLFIYGDQILTGKANAYWVVHGLCNIFLNSTYVFVFYLGTKVSTKQIGESDRHNQA